MAQLMSHILNYLMIPGYNNLFTGPVLQLCLLFRLPNRPRVALQGSVYSQYLILQAPSRRRARGLDASAMILLSGWFISGLLAAFGGWRLRRCVIYRFTSDLNALILFQKID
jgi:hypothetical protein